MQRKGISSVKIGKQIRSTIPEVRNGSKMGMRTREGHRVLSAMPINPDNFLNWGAEEAKTTRMISSEKQR